MNNKNISLKTLDHQKQLLASKPLDIHTAIKFLESQIENPSIGLPQEIFFFISRITPMINVDLLIKDENQRTLLSWRNDLVGVGWHLPGGIIRFKETIETRLRKVAETEIGNVAIEFDKNPIAINQIILNQNTRGHFISLLYRCFLSGKFVPENKGLSRTDNGYLMWHSSCPDDLLQIHEIYRKFI